MQLLRIISSIANHPLNRQSKMKSIVRFAAWQINSRLFRKEIIYPFTNKSKLIVRKGMAAATGNYYCGLLEFEEMGFLLHFLQKDDLFIDVGANIGSFTVLASAHNQAKSISFEPVPATFNYLQRNIKINKIENVRLLNVAVGSAKSKVYFTDNEDTTNHVAEKNEHGALEVDVVVLDEIVKDFSTPALLKIDVEGYETEVIHGATKTLSNPNLKAIIIELGGAGIRYGYDENDIHNTLLAHGFTPHRYDPLKRELSAGEGKHAHSTLYVRDYAFVSQRLASAPLVRIHNIGF